MPAGIGIALGVLGAVGKAFGRGRANREMRELLAKNPIYSANPIAKQRLGLANTLLNARSPGAIMAERNILSNQGAQLNNINNVATDASQAISAASGVGAQTNKAFQGLSAQEIADYQRRYGNYENAGEGVIREDDKVFQDQVRRFQDEAQIKGGINTNNQNTWGDVSNFGFALADYGMSGGFNNGRRRQRTTNTNPYDYSGGGVDGGTGWA